MDEDTKSEPEDEVDTLEEEGDTDIESEEDASQDLTPMAAENGETQPEEDASQDPTPVAVVDRKPEPEEDTSLSGAFAPGGRDVCLTWSSPVPSQRLGFVETAAHVRYGQRSTYHGAVDDFQL